MILGLFGKDDQGQDLAEYCLISALVAMVGLALIYHASGGMQNMWNIAGSTLSSGNAATSSSGGVGTANGGDH